MSLWVVIGAGPSLNQEDVDYVKGKARVVVANNAYHLAPWADCLAAADMKWWSHYKAALEFSGRKFCKNTVGGVELFKDDLIPRGCNSGLFGMFIARHFGAKKILLLGFDMQGSHFFGNHPSPLTNPRALDFKRHLEQFNHFPTDIEVINCTQGSALNKYPLSQIRKEI